MIYLDYNATTPLGPEVRRAMMVWLGERFGNPSSAHHVGAGARAAVAQARQQVARRLGAKPSGVTFVSGATEGLNMVAHALAGPVVCSAVEHAAVFEALQRHRVPFVTIPVDSCGRLDPEQVAVACDPSTAAVFVMAVNNETGNRYDTAAIADAVHRRAPAALMVVDAVQAVGRGPTTLESTGADLLVLSGHKVHGPPGIGVVVQRHGLSALTPLIAGGGQERGLRGGTENLPGIVGLGAACAAPLVASDDLTRSFERQLLNIDGVTLNGAPLAGRAPGTVNVQFAGVPADTLLTELGLHGLVASSGSACAAQQHRPSHVLLAMGRTPQAVHESVRFSFGPPTTASELDAALEILTNTLAALHP